MNESKSHLNESDLKDMMIKKGLKELEVVRVRAILKGRGPTTWLEVDFNDER